MTRAEWAALLSVGASLVVVIATFWQWWDITVNGGMPIRRWARWMLLGVAILIAISLVLLLMDVIGSPNNQGDLAVVAGIEQLGGSL